MNSDDALMRIAGEVAHIGGWAVDLRDDSLQWSAQMFRILGVPPGTPPSIDDVLGMHSPADHERVRRAFAACAEDGTAIDEEVQAQTADGRQLWLRVVGEAGREESGEITRVHGALMDITERKLAEREREQLATSLHTTLERITDAFCTVDAQWRLTYVNRQAELLMGRHRDELLGRVVWESLPEIEGSSFASALRKAAQQQATVVVSDFYAPLRRWIEARIHPVDDGLAVYFRDITDQVKAREVLLERQAMLDKAHDAIWALDMDHRATYWNAGATRLWGHRDVEVIGRPLRDVLAKDPAEFDAALEVVTRTGEWSGEMIHVDRAGHEKVVQGRWTLVTRDDGRPRSILAINTDVTEIRRVEQQSLHAQRLESIGTLAGGIAHDLNNVLTPILMSVELLAMEESDPKRLEILQMVAANTRRGADMVRQVLSFAGQIEGRRTPVILAALVADVARIISDTFPKHIAFTTGPLPDHLTVLGDPTQLHQVLLNLALNARDAMPDGGTLDIEASTVHIDEQYASLMIDVAPGPYIVLRLRDSGEGMPPEVVARIFDPFFTTKGAGKGTGLGLSTSLAIIKSHGGVLQVRSEPGVGTTMEVFLPAAEATGREIDLGSEALPRGNGQVVLVIDDEATVRASARRTLERFGYRVLTAEQGADAVAMMAQGVQVDVVLTDMMMPVMDGPATIRALRDMHPDLAIVAASGLDATEAVARAIEAGVTTFLPKPYTSSALLAMLQSVLDLSDADLPTRRDGR